MTRQTHVIGNHLEEDARALVAATAGVTGKRIEEARGRLAAALERGKHAYQVVREEADGEVKAADLSVRENPYQAIGIALAVGALAGFAFARRYS